MHPHICTEPTGFIIAVGSDPKAYKGSQVSLPPADKQWYKGNDGGSGEGMMAKMAPMVEPVLMMMMMMMMSSP